MTYAKKILSLLLLSVAATLGAAAQDAHAKFTLPYDATWGKAVLPAGTYTVSLEFGGITKAYVSSEGGSKVAFVTVPASTEVSDACVKSAVDLERSGSRWSVRSVCFGALQLALYFPAERGETALAALPEKLEVLAAGR